MKLKRDNNSKAKSKKSVKLSTNISVQITTRDILIFAVLANGPVTLGQLLMFLLQKIQITRTALNTRLSLLCRARFIESRSYPDRSNGPKRFALYGLSEHAVVILVYNGYTADQIRRNLPSDYTVIHELMVTDAVRTMRRESSCGLYSLDMRDENALKSFIGVQKHGVYPDLHVRLSILIKNDPTKEYRYIYISVEIDNGTLLPEKVVSKTRQLATPIVLFLCRTVDRIETLMHAFEITRDDELCARMRFGLVCDFSRGGFGAGKFCTFDGITVGIL